MPQNVAATIPCPNSCTPTDPRSTDGVPVTGPPPPPLTTSKLRALDYPNFSPHVKHVEGG